MSAAPPPVPFNVPMTLGRPLLDLLVLHLHSHFLELAAQGNPRFPLRRDTDDISHDFSGKLTNPLPIHLFKHLLLHPLSLNQL